MTVWTGLAGAFVDLLPNWELPEFLVTAPGKLSSIFTMIDGFGAWAPFGYLGVLLSGTLTVYVGGFIFKLVRAAVAHSPVSGGAG